RANGRSRSASADRKPTLPRPDSPRAATIAASRSRILRHHEAPTCRTVAPRAAQSRRAAALVRCLAADRAARADRRARDGGAQHLHGRGRGACAAPDVLEKAKHHILDTFAAMVSGSELPPGKAALALARAEAGRPVATVVGSNIVTGA